LQGWEWYLGGPLGVTRVPHRAVGRGTAQPHSEVVGLFPKATHTICPGSAEAVMHIRKGGWVWGTAVLRGRRDT